MTSEDDFQASLDANPDDHLTRLVFADWLQERDDPRAEGYRALGVNAVHAYSVLRAEPHYKFAQKNPQLHGWGAKGNTGPYDSYPAYRFAIIARDWFDLIRCKPLMDGRNDLNSSPTYWKYFLSRSAAEDAAAVAFLKLPAQRRAELLSAKAGANEVAKKPPRKKVPKPSAKKPKRKSAVRQSGTAPKPKRKG